MEGFRNYASESIEFEQGFNVFAGRNAQGKTNLLEAVYLLATTRLLRGQRDAEAINTAASRAVVSVELAVSETKLSISLESGTRKKASINGLGLPRASDLIGRLPCVCVSALDLAIVRGEPSDRRLFLDLELSSLFPAYLQHLTHYKRSLEQRNALLRESRERMQPSEMFDPWEEQMGHHGSAIRHARQEYVQRLSQSASLIHLRIGDGEEIGLRMINKDQADNEGELKIALAGSRIADMMRGGTGVGPHRDDLGIDVGKMDSRLYASQGQQRTAVISMKLGSMEICREESGAPPVLLLDDILSDLDEQRRSSLVDLVLENAGQTLLTCTEAYSAGPKILDRAKVFEVDSGRVSAA